jgi:hypothetical protein
MKTSTSWALTIGAAVVAGCLLVAGFAAFFALWGGGFYRPTTGPEGLEGYDYESGTIAPQAVPIPPTASASTTPAPTSAESASLSAAPPCGFRCTAAAASVATARTAGVTCR